MDGRPIGILAQRLGASVRRGDCDTVRASRYTRYRLDPVFDRTPDGAVIDLEWLTWLGTEDRSRPGDSPKRVVQYLPGKFKLARWQRRRAESGLLLRIYA
jgi:hypothetical protein